MKDFARLILAGMLACVCLVACQKDEDLPAPDVREKYLGQWMAFESEGQFAPQSYSVEIVPVGSGNDIVIRGIYDYDSLAINASVEGNRMEIPKQHLLQYSFWGSGQATSTFDQITINFKVQDTSGIDSVKAILTR